MADRKNINGLSGSEIEDAGPNASLLHVGGRVFEIHVKGQLNSRWSEWLE